MQDVPPGAEQPAIDPDDYYRQYPPTVGYGVVRGLHQDALRTSNLDDEIHTVRSRKSSVASTQSQDRYALRNSKSSVGSQRSAQVMATKSNSALGAVRKSSFKDLVARFDASPTDVPPVPVFPESITESRKSSPVLTMAAQGNTWKHAAGVSVTPHHQTHQPRVSQSKKPRPLFGEVSADTTANNVPGFGIVTVQRRRGSEGSPMHSPNPMFTADDQVSHVPSHLQHPGRPSGHAGSHGLVPVHRRAASDLSPSRLTGEPLRSPFNRSPQDTGAHTRRTSTSRIPISIRRPSTDSNSGTSTPSSRAQSKAGYYAANTGLGSHFQLETPGSSRSAPPHSNQRQRPSRQVKSPGKRGQTKGHVHGDQSPSLRANIIAPPPKISPPLRSSRPRLPVSSATTAASRARIAERFQTMAKEQTDRRSASRKAKPPELTDIDLKARRLKITQALTRSREGQELRGEGPNSASRSGTPALSEGGLSQSAAVPPVTHAVVVQNPSLANDGDVFTTPEESTVDQSSRFVQEAMSRISNAHADEGGPDSPTLGQDTDSIGSRLPRLDIPQSYDDHEDEPTSALTQGTVETTFEQDDEPQSQEIEPRGYSLFKSHRNISAALSASPLPPQVEDRTDAESVNLVLRNTAYMDEEEAVAKGYRNFIEPPLPDVYEGSSNGQGSWTSSIAGRSDSSPPGESSRIESPTATRTQDNLASSPTSSPDLDQDYTQRLTTASNAYTIVNVVLQERSSAGVVDQQLVDDIYGRIVGEAPELAAEDALDPARIEELCLREVEQYAEEPDLRAEADTELEQRSGDADDDSNTVQVAQRHALPSLKDSLPPTSFRSGHRYKSSLDSVEDWADTSPSVGDWMQYAISRPGSGQGSKPSPLIQDMSDSEGEYGTVAILQLPGEPPVPPKDNVPAPIHSPPPPPIGKSPPKVRSSLPSSAASQPAMTTYPDVPGRVASLSQVSSRPVTRESSNVAPSISTQEGLSSESKRLNRRRHIMKEIVDTEFTYERDMRVLCDIYKQTAFAVLSEEDIKIIFGNVEEIQQFSKDFLTYLKQVVRPVYTMERKNRTTNSHGEETSVRSLSPDLSADEKDRMTQVGVAFEASIEDLSTVYTDYIKSRQAANKRLSILQTSPAVADWLRECSENSKDITHAWSLDALSVKPIQRITKYPLLLLGLLESTPDDHPDMDSLKRSLTAMTDINFRINDIKKQTEIVDQVLNRKRKESDVRNGLSKAFGRRAERLRQHVGVSEVYEDSEYARLKMEFDNNGVHLVIVSKDLQGYIEGMKAWVGKLTNVAAAAEAWVDVGHTSYPQAESKLRQLGMAVRGITLIALPDHTDQVTRKVIQPLDQALTMMERFKSDPKGLLQKREKRIFDYTTARNRKDRSEKLDKKMTEKLEQWEAINLEVKQRMRKLVQMTQSLVHACLQTLVQLHMNWLTLLKTKLANAMAISLSKMDGLDLVKDWQVDYDYQEAMALSLSICNGSLLAEAANLVNFLSPSSTLTGDDSPRQSAHAFDMRSVSVHSDNAHLPPEGFPRYSSGQHSTHDFPSESSSVAHSIRMRATSITSSRLPAPRSSEISSRMPSGTLSGSRPPTSGGREGSSDSGSIKNSTLIAPRVSLDTPSPSLGPIAPLSTPNRPGSASTFFSVAAGPSNSSSHGPPSISTQASTVMDHHTNGGASIFSSAMPLTDSPMAERAPSAIPPGISPARGDEPTVLFTAASVYEFNIDRARQEGGIPYLTYVAGEIFDIIGERGELWLARNQDDPTRLVGWIWCKHFAKLAA